MHEWALAEAVLDAAEGIAREQGLTSVSSIEVGLGELQNVELEPFRFSLDEIPKAGRPVLEGARIDILTDPAKFLCKACGASWTLEDVRKKAGPEEAELIHFLPEMAHVYLRCTACAGPDFEVVEGRGVRLVSVKGSK